MSLSIEIGGVPGMDTSVEFNGAVFNDPTATAPIFISVAGSKVMGLQVFEDGNLTYFGDASFDKSAFADVAPNIKLPQGATMKWYNDPPFDPKEGVQYFDVTSSDGSKTKRYNITREKVEFNNAIKYSFEEWTDATENPDFGQYFTPLPAALQVPNSAVIMLKAFGKYEADGAFPASPEAVGKVGKAAKLVTLDTHGGFKFDITYTKPYTPSNNSVYKMALITSASVDEIELVTE